MRHSVPGEIVAETLPLAKKRSQIDTIEARDIASLVSMTNVQCATCGLVVSGKHQGQRLPRLQGRGVSHGICGGCRDEARAKLKRDRLAAAALDAVNGI